MTIGKAIIYFTDSHVIDFSPLASHTDSGMDTKRNSEFDKFKHAMKALVAVPLSEVKELEKKKKRKSKRHSASRATASKT